MEVRALCFDETDKRFRALPYDNATGGLKTDVNTASLAQEATLTLVQSDISLLNGKITSCDTALLATEVTALDSKNSLSSLDTKVTACDTTPLAKDATLALSNVELSNLNAKIVSCDTTAVAKDSSVLSGNASLSSIDTKLVSCDTSLLATEASQLSGNASLSTLAGAVIASKVQVEMGSTQLGSYNNLSNNVSVSPLSYTSVVDISAMKTANVVYEDSSTSSYDSVAIEATINGVDYIQISDMYPYTQSGSSVRTSSYMGINVSGFQYMRLKNKSSVDTYNNVKASVVSQS